MVAKSIALHAVRIFGFSSLSFSLIVFHSFFRVPPTQKFVKELELCS